MRNGKTSPAIFTCEGESLDGPEQFVVKLNGGMEMREQSAARELYGSVLAAYFGISVAQPALVEIDRQLIEAAAESLAHDVHRQNILDNSAGLNFGSKLLENLTTWPTDRPPLPAQASQALAIFAFDAMIQNPDRSFKNPNLAFRGNEIFIFDHEMAFSFLLNILPCQEPWKLGSENYLHQHVFARVLKGSVLPEDFEVRLSEVRTAGILQFISNCIPEAWKSDEIDKIENHLTLIGEHGKSFVAEVLRRLP